MKNILSIFISILLIIGCITSTAFASSDVNLDYIFKQAQENVYRQELAAKGIYIPPDEEIPEDLIKSLQQEHEATSTSSSTNNHSQAQIVTSDGHRVNVPSDIDVSELDRKTISEIVEQEISIPPQPNINSKSQTANNAFIIFYLIIFVLFLIILAVWIYQNHKSKKVLSSLDAELNSHFVPDSKKDHSAKSSTATNENASKKIKPATVHLSLSEKVKQRDFLVAKPASMKYFFFLCYVSPVWAVYLALELFSTAQDYSTDIIIYSTIRLCLYVLCVITLRSFSKAFLTLGSVLAGLLILESIIASFSDPYIHIPSILVTVLQIIYFYKRRFYFCLPSLTIGSRKD